jgi:hypothetical protein
MLDCITVKFSTIGLVSTQLAEMVTITTVLEKLPASFLKDELKKEDIKLFQNTRNYYNFAVFRRHQ